MMVSVLLLAAALAPLQWLLASKLRREREVLMEPFAADDWTPEEVDFWLSLIEPFPLRHPSRKSPSRE